MTPIDCIKATAGPLGNVGSAFYFAPDTLAVGKELGLDGMRWYMVGRGGVLGDCHADVVASAFGYFHKASVAKLWDSAREKIAPRDAGRRYHECAAAFGRAKYAGVAGLQAFNAAAESVIAHATPAGLALFAGIAAEPLDSDPAGRAQQLAAVLRELRGSAHIVALLAAGVSPEKAHFMKRPEMYKAFGYDEANPPSVTDADKANRDRAEDLTDQLLLPAYAHLDAASAKALADGADALAAALA